MIENEHATIISKLCEHYVRWGNTHKKKKKIAGIWTQGPEVAAGDHTVWGTQRCPYGHIYPRQYSLTESASPDAEPN